MSKMRIVIFGLALGSAAMAAIMARGLLVEPPKPTETVEVVKVESVFGWL